MKFLDKIALNRLIAIITNFLLAILKLFKPNDIDMPITKPKRPILDKLRNIFKHDK